MKKGFIIILALAILLLLTLIAITFLTLQLTERTIARNYLDLKRAQLIAQAGVDYAVARLVELNLFDYSWKATDTTPSFAAGTKTINGVTKGYSSVAGSTYGTDQDIFVLAIRDLNGLINVNDGLNNNRVAENLRRILNVLGSLSEVNIANLGDKIIYKRSTGYNNKQELLRAVDYDTAQFNKLKKYLTTHSWHDPNVANPVPLSSAMVNAGAYPVQYNKGITGKDVYRYGRGYDSNKNLITGDLKFGPLPFADPASYEHAIYALDELNPQWIEIVSRSPVNINTAPKEVLITLIKDLKGFFASDRRRNFPDYRDTYVAGAGDNRFFNWLFDYSPADPAGDELGFLYTTKDINLAIATNIADEIIKNRNFKSWRQFNSFCDSLTDKIKYPWFYDSRSTLYEYDVSAPLMNTASMPSLQTSSVAQKQATEALADLIKANFNPNLHLNETNPDANIKTLVDKTDLIVNSTEFCFTPMGYFEIESEGMILKEDKIIAQHKIEAAAKLFDAVRFTNEKQFLEGTLVESASKTNNRRALEIGPEPANVDLASASQNEWGGYIALSTVNGPDPYDQATLISHFSTNFNANKHLDGTNINRTTGNVADFNRITNSSEPTVGPYSYNSDNRLARSFRKDFDVNKFRAPADLRIDGAYIERHAGLAYNFNGTSTNVLKDPGMLCYWIKPWFHPETTGKPRTFFSTTKCADKITKYRDPETREWITEKWDDSVIFANFFLPTHWPSGEMGNESSTVVYYDVKSPGPRFSYIRSTSLISGYSADLSGGFGQITPFLNHKSHSHLPEKLDYLKSGQWIHVAFSWKMPAGDQDIIDYNNGSKNYLAQIFVNGSTLAGNSTIPNHYPPDIKAPLFSSLLSTGVIRIGEPVDGSSHDYYRRWTCDSTIDEFYVYIADPAAADPILNLADKVRGMYEQSRYYPANETSYKSGVLDVTKQMNSPSNSTIASPSASGSDATVSAPVTKLTGISWTYYGESTDASATARIKNYKIEPATSHNVRLKVSILKDDTPLAGASDLDNDGYSSINVDIDPAADYRYKVTFTIEGIDPLNTVLLYSPVFDDITIYYTSGARFIYYTSTS